MGLSAVSCFQGPAESHLARWFLWQKPRLKPFRHLPQGATPWALLFSKKESEMKLPVEYIESLKQALIPQQIAGRYTQLKQSGKGFTGKCPFHEEKTPSFWVYP